MLFDVDGFAVEESCPPLRSELNFKGGGAGIKSVSSKYGRRLSSLRTFSLAAVGT